MLPGSRGLTVVVGGGAWIWFRGACGVGGWGWGWDCGLNDGVVGTGLV